MTSYLRSAASYLVVQFDTRVADQETREEFSKKVVVFSRQKPLLASFLAIQLLFSILPVLGLLGFALSLSGLAVGFVTFWVGIGLCVMFSVLAVTATVATCVWISTVTSLISIRWVIGAFSGSSATSNPKKTIKTQTNREERKEEPVVLATKADRNGDHNQEENEGLRERNSDIPIKLEGNEISQKLYEEDTEGSDDTVGSYGALNQYTNRVKNEDLKWTQPNVPVQLSDAEKMRRDIARSLK